MQHLASDKGMGQLKARLLGITILLAIVIIGCEAAPAASKPLFDLQVQAPGPVSTCDDLRPEIIDLSSDQENSELGSLLKIYDIEQTSHSNTRLICSGNARTTTGEIDDGLIPIDFYKFTDADGEVFIGFRRASADAIRTAADVEAVAEIPDPATPSLHTFGAPGPMPTEPPKLVSSDLPAEVLPPPTTTPVETAIAVAPTELPAAEASPTPVATVLATPEATAVPEPDLTIPTVEPTPAPTSTPAPTATATIIPTPTPFPIVTEAPQVATPGSPITPGDFFWEGESTNATTLGQVGADFSISTTVISPHDNDRGLWSWGVGLTVGGVTQDIYVLSSSEIILSDPSNSAVNVTNFPFLIRTVQNSVNKLYYRAWNGVITIYINGSVAAIVEGLWDEPGELSIATNYAGTEIAQGYLLRSTDIVVSSTKLLRDEHFDGAVISGQETVISIDTDQFDQLSATLKNPLKISGEYIDFGFRVELPVFGRELEIKQAIYPAGVSSFHLSLIHKPTGTRTWQNTIRLDDHDGGQFDVILRKFDGALQLLIDGTAYPLAGLAIDFDQEHLENVEFFVNSDERVIDSTDASFLALPYVRVTDFGLWND